MSEEKKVVNGSMNDVLGAIKGVQEKNVYPIFIPSLQKDVLFKEMTTRQEKMIVKTIVDSPIYNSEFIFAIRTIIKENCAEDIDIDSLTIIDKTAICLTMRMQSIGNEFDYLFTEEDRTKTIKISDYVKKFKTIKIPKDKVVGTDDIKVLCGYPSIVTEYDLEREFRSSVDALEIDSLNDARDAIGDVFTNELVKYIKEITIIHDGNEMQLNMEDYNFKNRISILEEIGNSIANEILTYIEDSNKNVREKLKVELELDTEDRAIFGSDKLTSMLETGSSFFIIS